MKKVILSVVFFVGIALAASAQTDQTGDSSMMSSHGKTKMSGKSKMAHSKSKSHGTNGTMHNKSKSPMNKSKSTTNSDQ